MEATQKKNKYEIDMCNGTIMDKLISFSLPLMLSGILQLMFNAVDIIVVGRFSGSQSLAAVGSTTALINMFTNLFIGISLGANVLAARFYAAKREKEMSETVHTAITLALISGIVMAFVGLIFSRFALELMDTPDDVIGLSTLYMRIYFLGMPFFMLYNYGAAILRAVGDTKRPLFFLVAAGVINAGLNLLLVIVFDMGVAGVAIGTIVSQMISSILVLRCLCRSEGSYKLSFSKLRIRGIYMKQIFQVGIPAGIQSTVINFSNVLLQSSVNSFGSTAMAGYTAANNIFGFLYVTVNSVTQTCMSFTFPRADCLEQLLPYTGKKDIGILAPRRLLEGEIFTHDFQAYNLSNPFVSMYSKKLAGRHITSPTEIMGTAFEGPFIRREVVEKIGLPNKDLFIFCDDTDYCLRTIRAGYKILYIPDALMDKEKFFSNDTWNERSKKKKWKRFYQIRNSTYLNHHYGRNIAVKYLRGFNGVMGYIFIALFTSPFAKAYQWKDIPRLWKAYCDGIHEKLGIMS